MRNSEADLARLEEAIKENKPIGRANSVDEMKLSVEYTKRYIRDANETIGHLNTREAELNAELSDLRLDIRDLEKTIDQALGLR